MASPFFLKARKLALAFTLISSVTTALLGSTSLAAVLWSETLYDTDSDFGVGYYADIDNISLGTLDNEYEYIVAFIEPYNSTSFSFFSSGGNGRIAIDTTLDSVADLFIYAPNVYISPSTNVSETIFRTDFSDTGCKSVWSMTSTYREYSVLIPWRCLGAPAAMKVEGWLSNSIGYDFLSFGRTIYPLLNTAPAVVTVPVTVPATVPVTVPATVPPTTPPPTVPPTTTTVYVPQTLPLVAVVDTSRPGMVDDWIEYLIVKNPVSITAVLNSTDCCYGVKSGTRIMTVSAKSKAFCLVKGKRLYPLKKGSCTVTVQTGKGKTAMKETIKFSVRKK